jgi:hypothetical protein
VKCLTGDERVNELAQGEILFSRSVFEVCCELLVGQAEGAAERVFGRKGRKDTM